MIDGSLRYNMIYHDISIQLMGFGKQLKKWGTTLYESTSLDTIEHQTQEYAGTMMGTNITKHVSEKEVAV